MIGRDDLLHDIAKLLDDGERVLLQGFGGMGKTALAATAAGEWIKAGKGSVLWLKTGSASADALFEALARPFNAQQAIAGQQGEAKIQAVRQLLRGSGAKLLVLDDCWNGQALFTVLKAVPSDMPVIATARQRFALDKILDVEELVSDSALDFLSYYADKNLKDDSKSNFLSSSSGENPEVDAVKLCKILGYHPLALEYAGIMLKVDKLSPGEFLKRVQNAPQNLGMSESVWKNQSESINATIAISLASVQKENEGACRLFRAFGALFAPTATPQLLAFLAYGKPEIADQDLVETRANLPDDFEVSDDELRELMQQTLLDSIDISPFENALDTLARHGLIRRIPSTTETIAYYKMHELAHNYAKSQIARLTDQHYSLGVEACLTYTKQHNEPNPENFAALRAELDNLLGAAAWALTAGYFVQVEQLTDNLYAPGGSQLLDYSGLHNYASMLLQLALEAAIKQGDIQAQAKQLTNLGSVYSKQGNYEQAIKWHNEALSIFIEIQDSRGRQACLNGLGTAYAGLKEFERAIEYYESALEISDDQMDKESILMNLANAHFQLEQTERAIELYEQTLVEAQTNSNKRTQAGCLSNLANVYDSLTLKDKAIECLDKAFSIAKEMGDKPLLAAILHSFGIVHRTDKEKSLYYFEQARLVLEAVDNIPQTAYVDENILTTVEEVAVDEIIEIGNRLLEIEEYEHARNQFEMALALAPRTKYRRGELLALISLGNLSYNSKEYQEAIDYLQQALNIAQEFRATEIINMINDHMTQVRTAQQADTES